MHLSYIICWKRNGIAGIKTVIAIYNIPCDFVRSNKPNIIKGSIPSPVHTDIFNKIIAEICLWIASDWLYLISYPKMLNPIAIYNTCMTIT